MNFILILGQGCLSEEYCFPMLMNAKRASNSLLWILAAAQATLGKYRSIVQHQHGLTCFSFSFSFSASSCGNVENTLENQLLEVAKKKDS